jgi:hypothetical protein
MVIGVCGEWNKNMNRDFMILMTYHTRLGSGLG